jgi:adenylyltransferase/sulfurtransferase
MLTDTQVERYSRQIILPAVGGRGQEKLLASTLAVVDTADRQSILARYLAAAGVGRLILWRPGTGDPAEDIASLNSDCAVEHFTEPEPGTIDSLIALNDPVAVVLLEESADLAEAVVAACVRTRTPLIWGRVVGAVAYLAVFDRQRHRGCRACALPFDMIAADEGPLDLVAAGILATQLALEALKLALGGSASLAGRSLRFDAGAATVESIAFASTPACALCDRGQSA